MAAREKVKGWGPQTPSRGWPSLAVVLVGVVVVLMFWRLIEIAAVVAAVVLVLRRVRRRRRASPSSVRRAVSCPGGLAAVQARAVSMDGGVYLGEDRRGNWRAARPERALLVLGPPRSGKTQAVILPAVLSHPGPVVSTSTKPDVLEATGRARGELGRAWSFDPAGTTALRPRVEVLRWSPVTAATDWDGALLTARSMVLGAGVGAGTTDGNHWSKRAQALLAALLHAAALKGVGIEEVCRWVLAHDLDHPGDALQDAGAERAAGLLAGLVNTEARERSSIFSAAADALDAYSSSGALAAASEPNFDADAFVRSEDTVYVHAPAQQQHMVAPLICGLLGEIRDATYRAHAAGELPARVLFALDEVANIAPLADLPSIASEGGGQGLLLLAALQDLSQARVRWGAAADGFLTLFGSKLILPGVADQRTLEAVSVALGEYDRQVTSRTHGRADSRTVSVQRQRVISPGDVANIPARRGLHLDGVDWELLCMTPAFAREPWRSLIGGGVR